MSEKEGTEGGIKVTDKRRFETNGTPKPGEEVKREETSGQEGGEPVASESDESPKGDEGSLPVMDFSTFILSLATSAQIHLGVVPNPHTGKPEQNLAYAKETIDLLGLLQEKTKGNLNDQESRLMEHVLYDLRMIYIEIDKNGNKGGKSL